MQTFVSWELPPEEFGEFDERFLRDLHVESVDELKRGKKVDFLLIKNCQKSLFSIFWFFFFRNF